MARHARVAIETLPHHIIHRGNNRQRIFQDPEDYRVFLTLVLKYKQLYRTRLFAYVLMTNHFHLIIEPEDRTGLAKMMHGLAMSYARYTNKKYHRTGTIWESRFKSSPIETDRYLLACMCYVELNPMRAGIVSRPEDYPWSSYLVHALGNPDPMVDSAPSYDNLGKDPAECGKIYRELCNSVLPELRIIRNAINRNLPVGSKEFIELVSTKVGRNLAPRPIGRPRKTER